MKVIYFIISIIKVKRYVTQSLDEYDCIEKFRIWMVIIKKPNVGYLESQEWWSKFYIILLSSLKKKLSNFRPHIENNRHSSDE